MLSDHTDEAMKLIEAVTGRQRKQVAGFCASDRDPFSGTGAVSIHFPLSLNVAKKCCPQRATTAGRNVLLGGRSIYTGSSFFFVLCVLLIYAFFFQAPSHPA